MSGWEIRWASRRYSAEGGRMFRTRKRAVLFGLAAVAAIAGVIGASASAGGGPVKTATPIKHLVVIFQENVSYDHYFGTYPQATNTDGAVLRGPGTRRTASRRTALDPGPPASSICERANPNRRRRKRLDSNPPASPVTRAASSPATRITTTATSSRPWTAGRWTSSSRASAPTAARSAGVGRRGVRSAPEDRHGLLRRQHGHRRSGTTPSTTR